MSELLIKEIEIDGVDHPIGDVMYDETTSVKVKIDNKVDKVTGKDLSTNDYTTTEKNKLASIATGANQVSVQSSLNSGYIIGTIDIKDNNDEINLITLYAPKPPTTFIGSNSGLVPKPDDKDTTKFLNAAGQWAVPEGGSGGGVATTDAVIENSLTVNGYVVEGNGHFIINFTTKNFYTPPTVTTNSTNIIINGIIYNKVAHFNSSEAYTFIKNNGNVIKDNQYYYGKMLQKSCDGGEIEVEGYFYLVDCSGVGTSVSFYYIDGNYYYNDYISSLQVAVITYDINKPIHIQGKYSNIDKEYAHVVGGGTSDTDRKNIHTIDWDGNAYFAGDISLNSVSSLIETIQDLQSRIAALEAAQS